MPAGERLCNTLRYVAGAFAQSQDGSRELHGDRSIQLQTGNHSLPGRSVRVGKGVQLKAILCTDNILGADGGGLVGHCPDVAGAPMGPNIEFSAMVRGVSVTIREPSLQNSSRESAANSLVLGSMNAVWPGQPVAV